MFQRIYGGECGKGPLRLKVSSARVLHVTQWSIPPSQQETPPLALFWPAHLWSVKLKLQLELGLEEDGAEAAGFDRVNECPEGFL